MINVKFKKYDDETLNHLHDLELMILKDFSKICEDYGLKYYMYAGSLLGAIRHKGFIPWDDDLDVVMFREDFEKFKKIFPTLRSDKYELLSNETNEDYFYYFAKIMIKDTRFEEEWINQLNFHIGINIDIFVLDDLSDNKISRKYQIMRSFLYNRLLITSNLKLDNLSFFSRLVSHSLYYILNFFNLNTSKMFNRSIKFLNNYSNRNSECVFDIAANANEYPQIFKKSDFGNGVKVDFEDTKVNVPINYEVILESLYGDYMELPPEDKRYNHMADHIDFGQY